MTTTPYLVKVGPTAARQIKELSPKNRKHIIKVAESLAVNPRPTSANKIEGMIGLYAEIIGDVRLIYKIEDQEIWVLLVK